MKDKLAGKYNQESGISTLEILIAMVILITTLSTIILVVFSNQNVTVSSQNNSIALYRASQIMERARSQGAGDFNNLVSSSSFSSDAVFSEGLLVTDVNPCKKNVTANVSWSIGSATPQAIEINSIISNPAEAFALGGNCGSNDPPATEWWYPLTYRDYDLNSIQPTTLQSNTAGVGATSIGIVEDGSKYAILTTNHSSEDDFWIINVDDGLNAFIVNSLETTAVGLNNADVAGNHVFTLTAGSFSTQPSELQIIDISTISAPSLVATKSLGISGSDSTFNPNADAIYYYGGKIYVGTHRTGGNEFQIYSASSPFNLLGSLEINHNVNEVVVRGNYAYLATSDNSGEVMVIDISNPASLIHPDSTGMKYNAPGDYDGSALFLLNYRLYLGRERATSTNDTTNHNFFILDVETPISIVSLGSKKITRNPTQVLDITALNVVSTFAFLGTNDNNAEFQVFRVGNPANIYNCAESPPPGYAFPPEGCGKYNFPAKVTDVEFYDNFIYSSIESNATFRIIYDDDNAY